MTTSRAKSKRNIYDIFFNRQMIKHYLKNSILIFCLLFIKTLCFAGNVKNDGKYYMVINPLNANQKILNDKFEVLLTSKTTINNYHRSKAQDIGIVYDEYTGEEKFLYKNYIRNNNVDLNYLRNNNRDGYQDEWADAAIYSEWANYDGGSYRYANKLVFYDLNGKQIVKEFNDVGFKKFYKDKFYYEIKSNDPEFYIWDSKTNETKNIGKYAICKMIEEDNLIVFEDRDKKTENANSIFDDIILFFDTVNGREAEFVGYNFSETINLDGNKYYKIFYIKPVLKKSKKSNYEVENINNKFFNLVDEKFNLILKNDINENQLPNDYKNSDKQIDYIKIIEKDKRNGPDDKVLLETIGVTPANIIKIFEFEDDTAYLIKNKNGFALYNQDGKQISTTHNGKIEDSYLDKSLYNSIFLTPDENSHRNYFYIDESNREISIEYNRNTMLYTGDYGYYAVTNIDVTDSELNYIGEDSPSPPMYVFNIRNLKNDNINFVVNSKVRGVKVYRLKEEDEKSDLLLINNMLYNINGEIVEDSVAECIILDGKLYITKDLSDNVSYTYNQNLKLIDTITNEQLKLIKKEYNQRYSEKNIHYEPIYEYDFIEDRRFVDEADYWRVSKYLPKYYTIEHESEHMKSGYNIKSYKLNSNRYYDLFKGNKKIVSFCKDLIDFNTNYFTYLKGYEYGLMDYDGNVLVKFSIFDDTEDEITHGWQLSTREYHKGHTND